MAVQFVGSTSESCVNPTYSADNRSKDGAFRTACHMIPIHVIVLVARALVQSVRFLQQPLGLLPLVGQIVGHPQGIHLSRPWTPKDRIHA